MKTIKIIYLLSCALIGLIIACSDEMTQALAPEFSSDIQEIIIGQEVTFKDESLGEPSKWNWYFEGGTPATSILFSPRVIYNTPGTYSVRLVIGRGNDSVSLTKDSYVVVNHPSEITVDFSADKTIATNEELITFKDLSTGYPIEWLWEFTSEDGVILTSTDQNPSRKFEPGIYTVKLTAANPNISSSKIVENFLTVIDKYSVAADFGAVARNTYTGGIIHFRDQSSGNVAGWSWTFEGGTPATSTDQNPEVTYTKPGKYRVKMIASNDVNTSTVLKEGFISVISSENLVMYFPFDGNSLDVGPNQLNPFILSKGDIGILFNADSHYSGTDAEGRSAAQFQSVDANNYAILSVPESDFLDFQTSDFTVAFWAKISNITKNMAIFHHGSGPGARPDNENRQSWFRFQPTNQYVRFCVEQKGKSGNWVEYTEKSMADGKWHHFVCIYKEVDGKKNGYMYIDGELKVSNISKDIKTIDKAPYYIGCNYRITSGNFEPENFLNGYLDDYILYKRALSDQEAKDLFIY